MKKNLSFNDLLKKERNREDILENSSKLSDVLGSAIKANDLALSTSAIKEFEDRSKKLQLINRDSSFDSLKKAIQEMNVDSSRISSVAKSIDTSAFSAVAKSIDTSAFSAVAKSIDTSAFAAIAKSIDTSAFAAIAKSIDTSAFSAIAKSMDTSAFTSIAKSMDTSAFTSIARSLDTLRFKSEAKLYGSYFDSISPISKIYSLELAKIKANIDLLGLENVVNSKVFIEAKSVESELIKFEPSVRIHPITTLEKSIKSDDPEAFAKAKQDIHDIEFIEQTRVTKADIPLLDENQAKGKNIDILIITGLPLELNIFSDVFEVHSRWQSDKFNAQYYFGSVKSKTKTYSVALTYGSSMGNFHAAQISNAAIEDLNPKIVISAGIGYTLNPNKLQLCDLHITNMIVHWGLTSKEYEGSGRKVRSASVQVKSNHLFQEIREYEAGIRNGITPYTQWRTNSKHEQPKVKKAKVNRVLKDINTAIKCGLPTSIFNELPKVEIGSTMVSDDAVIASLEEITKRSLFEVGNESQISGEMEAAGIAMSLSIRKAPIEFIAIRGISDFGFGKEALESTSNEFRLIAATRAATFIKSLLESDLSLPKSNDGVVSELGTKI